MKTKVTTTKKISEAVYETAQDLYELGFIDKARMQTYEALCREPIKATEYFAEIDMKSEYDMTKAKRGRVIKNEGKAMKNFEQYTDNAENWEPESKAALGQDEKYVKKASAEYEVRLDNALELQMISIRLQKSLIEDLKTIANANGIGYQPLMRDVLSRFARSEIQNIMRDTIARHKLEAQQPTQNSTASGQKVA